MQIINMPYYYANFHNAVPYYPNNTRYHHKYTIQLT